MSRIKTFEWHLRNHDAPPLEPDTEYLVMHEPTPENKNYGQGTLHGTCRIGPSYLYVGNNGTHFDSSGGETLYGNWRISHFVCLKYLSFTRVRS